MGNRCWIQYLDPGSYRLMAFTRGVALVDKVRADVDFEITDRNLDLRLVLSKGAALEGRVVVAQGAGRAELEGIQVGSRAFGSITFGDEAVPVSTDAKGSFRLENRNLGRMRIAVTNVPTGWYVRQMRFRGSPLLTDLLDFAGDGVLEIEIDDRPATISGSVTTGDRPVEMAEAVLIRWPVPQDFFGAVKRVTADDSGRFRFGLLAEGEYRVEAVSSADRAKLDEPGVLARLVSRGERVIVARGATPSVTVRVSDPGR